MIDEETLNKVCPVPDETTIMNEIKTELDDQGFIINNFNKGGIFYIIIRIFVMIYVQLLNLAQTLINNGYIKHAEGDWLEIKAADVGKTRKAAVKAKGYITIYRENYADALQITKGHIFKTKPDVNGIELKYYVIEETIIPAGEQIGKVLVEAEQTGTDYNLPADKITVSMIHLDGVTAINNEENWLYEEGADIEDLEALRERCLEAWSELAERTTASKLKSVAKGVPGVLDVQIDDQHPRGQGTADIIITSTSGAATQELLNKVEAATEYLKNNYDDFLFKSSTIVKEDITLIIYIAKEASTQGVSELAENVINNYMQIASRKELNCLYLDDLRYALKEKISTYKRTEFTTPNEDMELEKGKVIMPGKITVTVSNVGGA